MKPKFALIATLAFLPFLACKKDKLDNNDSKGGCIACADATYEDYLTVPEGTKQYILPPFNVDDECGYVTEGMVKYVQDGKTVALVKYGFEKEVRWATKTLCVDGDCETKEAFTCKFEQVCDSK